MTAVAANSPTANIHPLHAPMANAIRALSMDAVEKAQSGHPGMPMGMADVATVLFSRYLKFNPAMPHWPDRDRFILSAGHGSMLIYSLLYLTGYEDIGIDDIKQFRQLHARTAGHPEFGEAAGIETTTGPLGQGIANSVGFALAEAMLEARYGKELVDHFTYVIAGDGCLMEGISQEAISLAGHMKLSKLVVLWDDNKITIDGATELSTSEDMAGRFKAAGWDVQAIDGHDPVAIAAAIEAAQESDTPSLIACRTTIAYGAPTKSGSEKSHGAPLGAEEIAGTRKALGWSHAAFDVPQEVLNAWREVGERGAADYVAWEECVNNSDDADEFARTAAGELPKGWNAPIAAMKKALAQNPSKDASRKSSQNVLDVLAESIPELVGGSADLTGSNNTKAGVMQPVTPTDYTGRYIYWGIREHGMAAAMNGMALHKGLVPYGGTFMVFTDYCRPAIRLSALMKQRVVYVMTHDSIGLGEDGPTHQPVEHLASLRAIPNLLVFRPCDAVETAEAWEAALLQDDAPSILALSRQGLPQLRTDYSAENLVAKGGYVISPAKGAAQAVIAATGSEVSLAVDAQKQLAAQGIAASVVSMPCWELFDAQPESYRTSVFPAGVPVFAIEAALGFGWERYTHNSQNFIGMQGFGASAPAKDLYPHFGITAEALVEKVKMSLR